MIAVLVLLSFVAAVFGAPPHIVLMVMDDVGLGDVSAYMPSDIQTPAFDAVAKEGVLLQRHYATPVCSPSRATLLQGRFAWKTGLQQYNTIMPASTAAMQLDQATLAEVLRDSGYATHAIGKWHLGYAHPKNSPMERGFSSHKGYLQGEINYWNKTFRIPSQFLPFPRVEGLDWWENGQVVRNESEIYNKDLLDRELLRVLTNHNETANGEPLFLYYAHQLAHVPLEMPPPQWSRGCGHITAPRRRIYCAMMAALDDSIRIVAEQLKAFGMWDNTLLVVLSDNGGMPDTGFPSSAGSNFPLRAGKGLCFEGGVRVPALVSGGRVPAPCRGTVSNAMVSIADWFTTAATAAGAAVPPGVDGIDVWDAIISGAPLNRTHIPLNLNFHVEYPNAGIQAGIVTEDGWKLVVQNVTGPTLNYDGWFPSDGPSQPAPPNPTPHLFVFDLNTDPHERRNLFNLSDAPTRRMLALLQQERMLYLQPQSNRVHLLGLPELHHGVWAPWL